MEYGRDSAAQTAVTSAALRVRAALPWPDVAAGTFAFSLVALLAANEGGYWPTAWSSTAFFLAWLSIVVLLLAAPVAVSSAERAFLVASFALVAWIGVSTVWSDSVPSTLSEVQRVAAYVAIAVAGVLVVRARSYGSMLLGAWAGIVVACTYGLATRLFPERLGQFDPTAGYRLSAPVGYWNALGILAVLGIILAVGAAARRSQATSVLAAASLLVLVPTLYFTFSRGAWLALGVGLAVSLALDPRRVQLGVIALTLAVCPTIAVASAYGSEALTRPTVSLADATREGHRLALLLAGLAIVQGIVLLIVRALDRRIHLPARVGKTVELAACAVLVLALVVAVARLGGPRETVEQAHREFLVRTPPSDLNSRLFSLSSNGRADLWSVAWTRFEESPWTGAGAGTYEIAWLSERTSTLKVRDAHSLYAESLAEFGVVGSAVLALVLVVPLAAIPRGRRRRLVPVAAGAYAAFLVHAGIDWDWEMPAVMATGLLCGISLLAAARSPDAHPLPTTAQRVLVAGMLAIGVYSFAGIVGQRALASAETAASEGASARAEEQALRATRWQPWSSEALRVAGEAQLALGRRHEARSTLTRAVAKDPLKWELWLDLAIASEGTARTRAAQRAEQLNPLAPQIAKAREELGLEAAR
jgi:O-antigen ligase